ncbi:hypothetical protein J437_LFUL006119 [Ladona fulva]|uniref:HTH CENPB-type domain-containing protein n=1 Tax=Ladona fulva TaxID=123851 RepID=A0A8K0K9F1_LADFU|nr:hypothetical protein J437_LFUL006119 [Ladona fulva]
MKLAELMDIPDFMASDGWLDHFKKHHGITFKTLQGEAGAVDSQSLLEWQQQVLWPLLRQFSADDVFNLDETGLFWQLLPNKTMAFRGEQCTGGKKSKQRITLLVGANMSGSEKFPLLKLSYGRTDLKIEYISKETNRHYKKLLLCRRLEAMDEGKEFKFTLLDALHVARRAWEQVSKSTIRNCFAKAKFIEEDIQTDAQDAELLEFWEALPAEEKMHANGEIELSDFLEADERLATGGSFTLEEIAEETLRSEEPVESGDDDITVEEDVISFEEARGAWSTVQKFMQQRGGKLDCNAKVGNERNNQKQGYIEIQKETWMSPDRLARNQIEHLDKRHAKTKEAINETAKENLCETIATLEENCILWLEKFKYITAVHR